MGIFEIGDVVNYHGRIGRITDEDSGGYIVYFSDIDEEEWIDPNELYEQNY